ncbi:MAG: hypothetical protein MZU97_24045 [Bacillus subtilis]|nr:hypothetical protein [Bacillus subtilis]
MTRMRPDKLLQLGVQSPPVQCSGRLVFQRSERSVRPHQRTQANDRRAPRTPASA